MSPDRLKAGICHADGVLFADPLGRITAVNAVLCSMTGYRLAELLEFASVNELAPGVWPHPDSTTSGVHGVESNGLLFLPDTSIMGRNGQPIPVQIHGYPVMGRDGEDVGYSYVIRDVRLRNRLQDQIRLIEKMRSAGNLAAVVGHDINNLIGVVLGHAEIGLFDVDESHPVYHALKEIEEAAVRTTVLTAKLMSLAGRESIVPESVELNAWMSCLLSELQHATGAHVEIFWKPAPKPCRVKIDTDQARRMVMIPIENAREAIEATSTGTGSISLSVAKVEAVDLEFPASDVDPCTSYVRLTVADDGEGMTPATRAHLFEPFYTTRSPAKGRGLGLATLYGLVKQNCGFVQMDHDREEGTAIHIYLPIQEEA